MNTTSFDQLQVVQGTHLIVCAFGCGLLITFWLRSYAARGSTWPVLFFSLALLMWMAIDLIRLSFPLSENGDEPITTNLKWLFINIFSAFNNAFFIAAFPFFTRAFGSFEQKYAWFHHVTRWSLIILLANSLLVLFYIILWSVHAASATTLIAIFDAVYSLVTIGLFFYGAIVELTRKQRAVFFSAYLLASFTVGVLVTYLVSLLLGDGYLGLRTISLYAYHVIVVITVILLVTRHAYEKEYGQLEDKLAASVKQVRVLEAKLYPLSTALPEKTNNFELSQRRHLKFYAAGEGLVLELTLLDKGIVKARLVTSTLTREYKDLLWLAAYRKTDTVVKAAGGAHKVFGDIYKSILDIRKRWINPNLSQSGLPTLATNELIVQQVKGSG
ncbi:MAG: hypothetical protein AAF705_20340, partial [Bacteroidota bacterium]